MNIINFGTMLLLTLMVFLAHQETISDTTTYPTTTPQPDSISCPEDFKIFNNMCYVISDNATCPFHYQLPFNDTKEIGRNISIKHNNTYKLNVSKDTEYDYYVWHEILGDYGKLFTENFTSTDSQYYDQVAVNYTDTDETFITTDDNYAYICAYSATYNISSTYCGLYDSICTNNTDYRDTTNCHCRNNTRSHFCEITRDESSCNNNTYFNETICSECETIIETYKNPTITLIYNYIKKRIFVRVTSYLKLVPVNGNNPVYCYTDAEKQEHDVTYRFNFDDGTDEIYNKTFRNLYYTIWPENESIGHYWCKGFTFSEDTIESGVIIAEANDTRESFTMNITLANVTEEYPLQRHEEELENIKTMTSDLIEEVRFLHLYPKNLTSNTTIIAYRLYLEPEQNMNQVLEDIFNIFENVTLSPSYCRESTTIDPESNMELTWDKTMLGMTVIPRELCLKSDRNPVTRTCLGEYLYGTYWSDVDGSCTNNSGELYGSDKTIPLHNLSYSDEEASAKIKGLKLLVENLKGPISVDAHFVAQIIENVTASSYDYTLQELIEVASRAMDLQRDVLKKAQALLNTTDKILYSIDLALNSEHAMVDNRSFFQVKTKNIYVQVSKISLNYTGAAFYARDDDDLEIKSLRHDDNPILDDLELAIYITDTELEQIRTLNHQDENLIIVLFRHDSLFNQNGDRTPIGYLASLYVSGFEEPFLYDEVRVLTNTNRRYRANFTCNCWKYGVNGQWYNTRGRWRLEQRAYTVEKKIQMCKYWSMSHYAILIGDEGDIFLSIITVIGCVLSTLGCLGVVVTAIVYKTWRDNSGTRILLNFVTILILQNLVLGVSSSVDSFKDTTTCVLIGALLHYCVNTQFGWMLVIGYLQYQRYVKVFFHVRTRFVIYASIAAWGLPLIPIATILILDTDYYIQDNFCYLNDRPLYLGVFLPVSLILTLNFVVFALVLKNVCTKGSQAPKDSMAVLQLRLAILLVFLLGLYWVLGISARLVGSIALDYFFCIFATLQGLVVFLYFIVFNKMTRNFWIRQLKRLEMISSMQIWLQQRKKVGDVKLDRSETMQMKMKIDKSLNISTKGKKFF